MLFSFKMVCAANVDCDPRIVLVPSVQRAPNTYWFEGTRPQLEALVLCLSCLAGLANSFKHPLALFKWENRVSISVRKTQESAPPPTRWVFMQSERSVGGSSQYWKKAMSVSLMTWIWNVPQRHIKLALLLVLSWGVLETLACEANLRVLRHYGRS